MDEKQECLILSSLYFIINALTTDYKPIHDLETQKEMIRSRLGEINGFTCKCCGEKDNMSYTEFPVDQVAFWECAVCGYKNFPRGKYNKKHPHLEDIEEQNKEITLIWRKQ
jgi:Zn ribbon nucleic-acid-binding protein